MPSPGVPPSPWHRVTPPGSPRRQGPPSTAQDEPVVSRPPWARAAKRCPGGGIGCCAGVNSWFKSTRVVPGFRTFRRRRDPRPPAHHAGLPSALARGPLQVLVPKSDEDRTSFTPVGNAADHVMTADVRAHTSRLTRPAHPPTLAPKTFPADDPAVSSGGHHHDAPPLGFFVTFAFTLLVAPLAADARQATNVPRVGRLLVVGRPASGPGLACETFRQRLRALGSLDGQTLIVADRDAEGEPRPSPRPGGRAGPAPDGRHRRIGNRLDPCGPGRHAHDPDRDGGRL